MKRKDLIRHLKKKVSTIPRHREIDGNLAKRICNDLGISKP